MTPDEAWKILESRRPACATKPRCATRSPALAADITDKLRDRNPLVLARDGRLGFLRRQSPALLRFPLEFDYVQASRYGKATSGGRIVWTVEPGENVRGRTVLVLDDILDGGETLAAIRDRVKRARRGGILTARVLTDKDIGRAKPAVPDFVGLKLPEPLRVRLRHGRVRGLAQPARDLRRERVLRPACSRSSAAPG